MPESRISGKVERRKGEKMERWEVEKWRGLVERRDEIVFWPPFNRRLKRYRAFWLRIFLYFEAVMSLRVHSLAIPPWLKVLIKLKARMK
jgi:hypothetical protein